jgi:hypothetical protein
LPANRFAAPSLFCHHHDPAVTKVLRVLLTPLAGAADVACCNNTCIVGEAIGVFLALNNEEKTVADSSDLRSCDGRSDAAD